MIYIFKKCRCILEETGEECGACNWRTADRCWYCGGDSLEDATVEWQDGVTWQVDDPACPVPSQEVNHA